MADISSLGKYIEAGYSLFYCEDKDYARVSDTIVKLAPTHGSVFTWSPHRIVCEYWRPEASYNKKVEDYDSIKISFNDNTISQTLSPVNLLNKLEFPFDPAATLGESLPKRSIVVALLFDEFTKDPVVLSRCIEGITKNYWTDNYRQLVICTPRLRLDERLREYAIPIELPPVSNEELDEIIEDSRKSITCSESIKKKLWIMHNKKTEGLKDHMKGMPVYEMSIALHLAMLNDATTTDMQKVYDQINSRKAEIVKRSDVLSMLPPERQVNPKYIGGFDNFLEYMKGKALAFTEDAKKLSIDSPKGVVLIGVPGTGKSMAAKSLGYITKKPVIQMDMSSVFGSLVGQSESRVRQALKTVDAIQGCVLLIDEADKAFAGASGGSGDSGTTQRVLGTILNWLQEQSSDTFVIITMNRVDAVPPEFLRPGRFDKIFYTDVPLPSERRDILTAHLLKRGVKLDFTEEEWLRLQQATDDFTGSELEEVVKDARLHAFKTRGTEGKAIPTFDELLYECNNRIAMVKFDAERIDNIRKVCMSKAVPVSKLRLRSEVITGKPLEHARFEINDSFFDEEIET